MSNYADISRDSYRYDRHFLRVILQQGRALLDADFNEQTSILIHLLRQLNQDVHGAHWGPAGEKFLIVRNDDKTLKLTKGLYYVAGIPCVAETELPPTRRTDKPHWSKNETKPPYVVYVHVWERHRTPYEAPDPRMGPSGSFDPFVQDPALGHLDTTTRGEVTWRIGTIPLDVRVPNQKALLEAISSDADFIKGHQFIRFEEVLKGAGFIRDDSPGSDFLPGQLAAGVTGDVLPKDQANNAPPVKTDPCQIDSGQGYQGLDNQLFHIQVHGLGRKTDKDTPYPTFKWARDNASTIFPLSSAVTQKADKSIEVTLLTLGRGTESELKPGDWVELINVGDASNGDEDDSDPAPFPFYSVVSVDRQLYKATLKATAISVPNSRSPGGSRLFLRRWEQDLHLIDEEDHWFPLSDGVQVAFKGIKRMRAGDFWQIPARSLTHDVIWPRDGKVRPYQSPKEVLNAYAPLALVEDGKDPKDLRRIFDPDPEEGDGVKRYKPKGAK